MSVHFCEVGESLFDRIRYSQIFSSLACVAYALNTCLTHTHTGIVILTQTV
jgi:hypothetical protein